MSEERWEAARWFLSADGETGKRYGNETLRVTPDGQVSIKLPAPPAGLANAPHGRYVLSARACFAHRGEEWVDRVEADRASGVVGVDTNADHLAAWHLNVHGNPIGRPRRFPYDLTGSASHRDAQLRHALTGSCTGPAISASPRSPSRTSTSPTSKPARGTADAVCGRSSTASRRAS
ncbi:hypothetical protein [Actinocorallia herbida]|uniref:hypothetical protein n=1 Tax=Actinocorallia herbida TaxID=58109 RepID=UPI001B88554D|nr:hypothetical protein [Actinocorallia herbida]